MTNPVDASRSQGGDLGRNPENLTDLGNSRRMVRVFGRDMRHCERLGGFFLWDGRRWEKDSLRAIDDLAKRTIREMYAEAEQLSDSERKALVTHALKSENAARIRAMIDLARSDLGVAVYPEEFDANPWLLNVENGVVDLRTGELVDHDRGFLMTKLAPVEFDPEAESPLFLEFLTKVVTPEIAKYLQRLVGLSLLGIVREHVLVFLHGTGANGKTTLVRTIQAVFGDYGKQSDPELLLARRGETHPTGVADLFGTRMVATTEVPDGRRLAEALVKQLTGGDRVKARFVFKNFFEFDPTWTVWLAANHRPTVRGQDEGIWRRIKLIPFGVSIPPEDQDPDLIDKLRKELPGVLNWALQGCLAYQENGLQEPLEVKAATNSYRAEFDVFGIFLEEETESGPARSVEARALYARYKDWCDRTKERAATQTLFGRYLGDRGFRKGKDPQTRRQVYLGIGLKTLDFEAVRNSSPGFFSRDAHKEKLPETVSNPFGANEHKGFPDPDAEAVEPDWEREEKLALEKGNGQEMEPALEENRPEAGPPPDLWEGGPTEPQEPERMEV